MRTEGTRSELGDLIFDMLTAGPQRGEDAYRPPVSAEKRAARRAASALLNGDLARARAAADQAGLQLERVEHDGEHRLLVLHEPLDGPLRGWGLFAVDLASTSRLAVEVPHPLADSYTESVGEELLAAGARALVIHGTDRYAAADDAADVAHDPRSVFQAFHEALARRGTVIVQVHGFSRDEHPTYPEVVLSAGVARPTPVVRAAQESFAARDLKACVYDGSACAALAATRNVQARTTSEASFLHVELALDLRADPGLRQGVVEALLAVGDRAAPRDP